MPPTSSPSTPTTSPRPLRFSRDDAESTVVATYLDKWVFTVSPVETIDGGGSAGWWRSRSRRAGAPSPA